MLGRGEPTLSPPRFPLHQCTWMKGNAATVNRLVRGSPTNPGKRRGGVELKIRYKKKKRKIATRAAVDKGATQPGGGGGGKNQAQRVFLSERW